jgi:hypothetical protein
MGEPWLSDDELKELTGYVQPARQVRWLEQNRIKHYISRLNKVRVPPEAIAGIKGHVEKRTEPDFTKVRKANGAN